MPEEVRIWRIGEDETLVPLPKSSLDLESRLETWIDRDISVLDPELLVVGRQVETGHGGYIDLLCLNSAADVVIVELKRGLTPREVTAQALDYASWVKDLSVDTLSEIANAYLKDRGPLESAFKEKYGTEMPDVVNQNHSILVVGASIDASTERIMRYLSETYGVSINAATFQYFRSADGQELLARLFLMEPEAVATQVRARPGSKRRPNLTMEELGQIAEDRGVADTWQRLVDGVAAFRRTYTISSLSFKAGLDGGHRAVFNLIPPRSSPDDGLCFQAYVKRLCAFLGVADRDLERALPERRKPWIYYPGAGPDFTGYEGYFRTADEADRFVRFVQEHAPR